MTEDTDYTFTLTGSIAARDKDDALSRVLKVLEILDFQDLGDGTLWLNRPHSSLSVRGMALGEYRVSITDVAIEHASGE